MRRLATALWLALALLLGQQGAALHALEHAGDRHAPEQQVPPESGCDLCVATAPLTGAVAATAPNVPVVSAAPPRAVAPTTREAPAAATVYFHSRAPPQSLHA